MPRNPSIPKSEQTRQRILDTAKSLFRDHGYAGTTLRSIATEADVALGLTYRYFPQKEHLALALYGELADALDTGTSKLEPAPLADAFAAVMRKKLRLLTPQREAIAAVFAASVAGNDAVSVVGASTAAIREKVRAAFVRAVDAATDLPALDADERDALATLLYGAHLLLVLTWLVGPREGGVAHVTVLRELLAKATTFLALPPVRQALVPLARSLETFLEARS